MDVGIRRLMQLCRKRKRKKKNRYLLVCTCIVHKVVLYICLCCDVLLLPVEHQKEKRSRACICIYPSFHHPSTTHTYRILHQSINQSIIIIPLILSLSGSKHNHKSKHTLLYIHTYAQIIFNPTMKVFSVIKSAKTRVNFLPQMKWKWLYSSPSYISPFSLLSPPFPPLASPLPPPCLPLASPLPPLLLLFTLQPTDANTTKKKVETK